VGPEGSRQQQKLWSVAVNAPLAGPLTYASDLPLSTGQSVKVPFGPSNRLISALVIDEVKDSGSKDFKVKQISEVDEERVPLSSEYLKWLQWISQYYVYPLGQVQQLVYPPLKKQGRGSRKHSVIPDVPPIQPPALTQEQLEAVAQIQLNTYQTHLLHGVTGSGKTEIYIEVIAKVIAQGQTALILVPEISLTPQLIRRFAERFPDQIAVIHSHLTDREKTDQWWLAVQKEKPILIGARSALFCPQPKLGVIVVDEEHETSFKQEEKLKYNARDLAVVKGQIMGCPVILGSATPSLETWHNATVGKFNKISVLNRITSQGLPNVTIVNPRYDRNDGSDRPHWLSNTLYEKLKQNYELGHQSALFLNRRGVAPSVQCYSCGFIYSCPNCDISLTLHGQHHLVCHYCDYHEKMELSCPDCKEGEPKAYGLGTETVERDLATLFPDANILRADRDEIANRQAIEEMIHKMEHEDVHFLVGTQMIAKGLDFKNLSLVGIVLADIAFNIPDFRANERCFQLCTQVSGRAGRHQTKGEVVIQTYKEDHPSLVHVAAANYTDFVNQELEHRQAFSYPPFSRLAAIRLSAIHKQDVIREGEQLKVFLDQLKNKFSNLSGSQVLGPTPAPLARIKNRHRYHILIKAPDHMILGHLMHQAQEFIRKYCKKSKCVIDIDPYSLT
jgi:primosomal protein N' (replication factor Y) (superfamily II helicase)